MSRYRDPRGEWGRVAGGVAGRSIYQVHRLQCGGLTRADDACSELINDDDVDDDDGDDVDDGDDDDDDDSTPHYTVLHCTASNAGTV